MDSAEARRIAVLGPGGVGGLLAALLARAGHQVICLAGDDTVRILRRDGIRVTSGQHGDFTARVEADTELREPVHACLVTVKQTALESALLRLDPARLGTGLVVPLLNGVEHPELLRRRFRPELVAPGTIRVEAFRPEPGRVTHASPFTELELAGAAVPGDRLDELAGLLTRAGATTRVRPDETAMLWAKLSFLAPLALLTTRYQVPAGEIRTTHRQELESLVAEVAAVSRACGAPIRAEDVVARFDGLPAGMRSSMQRDAEAGRPLELDAIGGALLRSADRHGVPVPVATRVVAALGGA